jgi:hypothetical protein
MEKFKCPIAKITNGDACGDSELHSHLSDKMPYSPL